jgi:N-acetylmuramic acid 6-phosphate etherase
MLSNTEDIISNNKYIDQLSNQKAIDVMLNSHAESILVIRSVVPEIDKAITVILEKLKKYKNSRLVYVGAGTSGRIAVQDAVELYPTFGWPKHRIAFLIAGGIKSLTKSIEGAEDNRRSSKLMISKNKITRNDVVIGLAASGNTPFTVDCIERAKIKGALTIGIGNNSQGLLQKQSDISINLLTGAEIVAGSTRLKAGTAQKICLNIISTLLMTRLGFVKNGLMINLIASNQKLIQRKVLIQKLINTN